MLRRLILVRHAQSSRGSDDHARTLGFRGEREAPRIGEAIAELGWMPGGVVTSDAVRARQTWEQMRPAFPGAPDAKHSRALYLAGLDALARALGGLDDDVGCALAIGHNPGWSEAASTLTGESLSMGTCNAALMTVEADDWSEAAQLEGCWRLARLLRPEELP